MRSQNDENAIANINENATGHVCVPNCPVACIMPRPSSHTDRGREQLLCQLTAHHTGADAIDNEMH